MRKALVDVLAESLDEHQRAHLLRRSAGIAGVVEQAAYACDGLLARGSQLVMDGVQRRFRMVPVRFLLPNMITLAALYRTRPDTWAADNLDFGDRYFYLPRVLPLVKKRLTVLVGDAYQIIPTLSADVVMRAEDPGG